MKVFPALPTRSAPVLAPSKHAGTLGEGARLQMPPVPISVGEPVIWWMSAYTAGGRKDEKTVAEAPMSTGVRGAPCAETKSASGRSTLVSSSSSW